MEKYSYKTLEQNLKHAMNSMDKISTQNSELLYEIEMWRKAYEDLVARTGIETIGPYRVSYEYTIKKLRSRMERKLKKNAGK